MERNRERRRGEQQRRARRQRPAALALLVVMLAAVGIAAAINSTESSSTANASSSDGARETQAGTRTATVPTPPARGAAPFSVAAVGDTVMGSLPYGLPPDGGASLFDDVAPLLTGDVVLGNLEGTLSSGGGSKCGAASSNCFAFQTPPSYTRWLKEAGFTVMSLANNHALDFGPSGQRQTVAALTRAGIRNTGRPGTQATQTVKGQRIAILGFAPYEWTDSLLDIPRAKRRVQAAAQKAEIVIVTFHGGAEGSDKTRVPRGAEIAFGENRGDLRAFTHAVIDAGADLVIGHGPHVLRGMEVYKGRLIAYSLGNFMGYEVFNLSGPLSTSAVLHVTVNPDGTLRSGRIRPVRLVGAGVPVPGGDAVGVIRRLSRQDFGARAPVIAAGGGFRPRA